MLDSSLLYLDAAFPLPAHFLTLLLLLFSRCWSGTRAQRSRTSPMSPNIAKTLWSLRCDSGLEGQICDKREAEGARASSPGWDEQRDPIFTPYRTNKISVVETSSEGLQGSRCLVFCQTSSELITADLPTLSSSMASCKCLLQSAM